MDSQGEVDESDTIRCLIMTDNHVGYLERDSVRGDDSFRSFEEMLQLARKEQVRTNRFGRQVLLCSFSLLLQWWLHHV
jgi:hypothetical protein